MSVIIPDSCPPCPGARIRRAAAEIVPGLLHPAWGDTQASSLFTRGAASGDPSHDSVVIWTRLALDPLNGGGMPTREAEIG